MYVCIFFLSSLFISFGRQMLLLNSCKFLSPSYCVPIVSVLMLNQNDGVYSRLHRVFGGEYWLSATDFPANVKLLYLVCFCCFTSLNSVNVYWSMLSFVQPGASWVNLVVVYRGLPNKRCVTRPKPIKDVPRPCLSTSYNVRSRVSWLCLKFFQCLKYQTLKIYVGSGDRSTRA
jgi:hypothetical protein